MVNGSRGFAPQKFGAGLTKRMKLSEELQAIVGKERESRSEVVKDVWKYIKDHKLQDPHNKRFFYPDKLLAKVFGSKKIFTFKMSALMEPHFKAIGPNEV